MMESGLANNILTNNNHRCKDESKDVETRDIVGIDDGFLTKARMVSQKGSS